MKKILKGIGMIGTGVAGMVGLYKLTVHAFAWLFVLVIGGIGSLLPDKDKTED